MKLIHVVTEEYIQESAMSKLDEVRNSAKDLSDEIASASSPSKVIKAVVRLNKIFYRMNVVLGVLMTLGSIKIAVPLAVLTIIITGASRLISMGLKALPLKERKALDSSLGKTQKTLDKAAKKADTKDRESIDKQQQRINGLREKLKS